MIKEGSVVIVTGELDQSVRENTDDVIYRTIQNLKNGKVWVLLKDGTLWIGNDWEVYEFQGSDDESRQTDLR